MDGLIHISIASVDFNCPYCGTKHSDEDDKYYDRIVKNKQGWTRVKCTKCEKRMGLSPDIKGDLKAFCISEAKRNCDCWLKVGRCYCDTTATDNEPEPQMEI